jgi:hypothetical protein
MPENHIELLFNKVLQIHEYYIYYGEKRWQRTVIIDVKNINYIESVEEEGVGCITNIYTKNINDNAGSNTGSNAGIIKLILSQVERCQLYDFFYKVYEC